MTTLADFTGTPDGKLHITCNACGNKSALDVGELIERLGRDYVVWDGERYRLRLKCSQPWCGSGDYSLIVNRETYHDRK